jgi:hypothetical protein
LIYRRTLPIALFVLQEKLNEELIDLVLKLQKIEKQRKAAEIPHRESYQKLEKV